MARQLSELRKKRENKKRDYARFNRASTRSSRYHNQRVGAFYHGPYNATFESDGAPDYELSPTSYYTRPEFDREWCLHQNDLKDEHEKFCI